MRFENNQAKMKAKSTYFTSESVASGHPDKIADRISDAILDEVLKQDKFGKTAVETFVTKNKIILGGEVNSRAKIDYEKVARKEIKKLGYTIPELDFTYKSPVDVLIHTQSAEIAHGVHNKEAGDQGMMFGYACNETPEKMPLPITIANALVKRLDEVREKKELLYLRPDGKSQVTVQYKGGIPVGITKVILAAPHEKKVGLERVKKDLFDKVVVPVLKDYGFEIKEKDFILNGTSVWHYSGPAADTGLTGRKIVVDTYGGYARVGGGAFSGKDPSKVDRSGAYASRFLAKNIVANDLADKAEVYLAYHIGAKKPLMQEVETFGTEKVSHKAIIDFMNKILDTSVVGIIEGLCLRRPIYKETSSYGHFGRTEFPWEKVLKV